jgi:hypothetical protein
MIDQSYEKNARNKGAKYGKKEEDTYISRRSSSSVMSTGASILVDSVGPPRADVCRTADVISKYFFCAYDNNQK